MRSWLLFAGVLGCALAGWAEATVEVAADGTQADIVDALAAVDDNGTVVLLGSEYTLTSALAISRSVTLKGQGRDATVLRGDGQKHRGVVLSNNGAVLCDLTVQGFLGANDPNCYGTGVRMTAGTVRNCHIAWNTNECSWAQGAGVYMTGGSLLNCIVERNRIWSESGHLQGAGVWMSGGWVEGCLIVNNNTSWNNINCDGKRHGGGVYLKNGTIVNSTIAGNLVIYRGGGIYVENAAARLYNCIVSGNDAGFPEGALIETDFAPASTTNQAFNCLIGGSAVDKKAGLDGVWSALDEDFKLTVHSAGIAKGDATVAFKCANDLAGNPRVHDGVVDIGCYAYAGSLAPCGIGADRRLQLVGQSVTLTAYVHSVTAPASYAWTVTKPDSTTVALSGSSPSLLLDQVGIYGLSLAADGQTTTKDGWLTAAPLTNTVHKATSKYVIHEALAAAPDGQVILLPDDDYMIATQIVVRSDIHLIGAGYTNTTVRNTVTPDWQPKNGQVGIPHRVFYIDSPGAVVEGVTASNGKISGAAGYENKGLGICVGNLGGTVRFCRITKNIPMTAYNWGTGVALLGEAARLENSIVDSNTSSQSGCHGGGVYVKDGTVESCLICNNTLSSTSYGYGGGVYMTGSAKGRILNSTIVKNTSGGAEDSRHPSYGGGIYFAGTASAAQIVNCIVLDNTSPRYPDPTGGSDWYVKAVGSSMTAWDFFDHCLFDSALNPPDANGNLGADKATLFVDSANDDYHLLGSTFLDKGKEYAGLRDKVDLDGNPRLIGNAPEMGCYEIVKAEFIPTFTVSPEKVRMGSSTTLTPDLSGAPEGNLKCRWILACDGGLTVTNESAGTSQIVVTLSCGGRYDVSLEVFDADSEKSVSSVYKLPACALAASLTNYVTSAVATAHPVPPFDTPETAATNLNEVVEKYTMDGSVVLLNAGTHLLRDTVSLQDGVTITGAGKDETRLMPTNSLINWRCVSLDHAQALVEKVGFYGFYFDASYNKGPGEVMFIDKKGGTIRDCLVSNVTTRVNGTYGTAFACWAESGVISRCKAVFNRMSAEYSHIGAMGVIYANAGRITDCLVVSNRAPGCAGIAIAGSAEVWNCTIAANEGIYQDFNSEVYYALSPSGLLVQSANCRVMNCLVADIIGSHPDAYAPCLGGSIHCDDPNYTKYAAPSATLVGTNILKNCLFTFDDPSTVVGYRCLNADPKFVDATNADYRVTRDSPCRHAGQYGSWMAGALDLYGNPRELGRRHPDIGCQQLPPCGLVIITR